MNLKFYLNTINMKSYLKKNEKTARKSREEMGKKRGEIECAKPLLKHDKYEILSKKDK